MSGKHEMTLQDMLKKAGVKQRELADLLGLHESTVSLKIAGKRPMDTEEARIIAMRLKTTIDQVCHAVNFAKCKETKPHDDQAATLEQAG